MNKSVIKTVAAAAVTAAGVHFADDYATKTQAAPSQMTYYAVAAGAVLGSYVLRRRGLISGALLGAGLGAAYQGYSHRPLAAATTPVPVPTKATPAPAMPAPAPVQYLPPAAGANSSLPSFDLGKIQQQATGILDQLKGLTGLGDGAPVQYSDQDASDYDY